MKSEIINNALRGRELDALGKRRKQVAILLFIPTALLWFGLTRLGLHALFSGLITCIIVAAIGTVIDNYFSYGGDHIFYRIVATMICATISIICMIRYL